MLPSIKHGENGDSDHKGSFKQVTLFRFKNETLIYISHKAMPSIE